VLTNSGKVDEANTALQVDRRRSQQGGGVLPEGRKSDQQSHHDPKTGKVIPAPHRGALNKYLELQPTGQFADGAKACSSTLKQHRDQLRREEKADQEVPWGSDKNVRPPHLALLIMSVTFFVNPALVFAI
jgi:hypothetical protein